MSHVTSVLKELLTMDSNASSLLVLLDLSAAFNTIDHSFHPSWSSWTLCSRLFSEIQFINRMQLIICEESKWKHCNLSVGLPQGLVLGPRLLAMYMLPLGDIISSYGISFPCYADDTQIYIPIGSNNSSQIQVESCLTAIKRWTSQSYLQMSHLTRSTSHQKF